MKLNVSLIQTDIVWGEVCVNLERTEAKIGRLAADGTDLAVLPEMFATGYMTDSGLHAEGMEGEIVGRMRTMAARYSMALCGTVAVRESDAEPCRNRFIFAKPDGTVQFYDKRHLFGYGGEGRHYARGTERVVVEYGGFRIMPQVCYDLRFPAWSRYRGDYDVLIYAASWASTRIGAWDALLRARAIENQCYVIGVNRVGSDPTARYCGHSTVFDFKGEQMCSLRDGEEGTLTAELQLEPLQRFREKFRVWEDADRFTLE